MDDKKQIEIEKKDDLKWWDAVIPFFIFITVQVISGLAALIIIFTFDWKNLLSALKSNTNSAQISVPG